MDKPAADRRPRSSPDDETQESVIFGTTYTKCKLYDIEIYQELEIINDRTAALLASLDLDKAQLVLKEHLESVMTDAAPKVDEELKSTVYTLRDLGRLQWAQAWLSDRLTRIKLAGRICGSVEHSVKVLDTYSEDTWRESARSMTQRLGLIKHPGVR